MIEEIYIRDLGVIQEARLPFGKGLTVITGETGAGKTMVLSALGLLLGGALLVVREAKLLATHNPSRGQRSRCHCPANGLGFPESP